MSHTTEITGGTGGAWWNWHCTCGARGQAMSVRLRAEREAAAHERRQGGGAS